MSVDIQWETLTAGPDGARLAENIRSFIHNKFQQVPLPRFIKSVQVHAFDFGTTPPELDLKDICDPLPEFYKDFDDDYTSDTYDLDASGNDDNQAVAGSAESSTQRPSTLNNSGLERRFSPLPDASTLPSDATAPKRHQYPTHLDTSRTTYGGSVGQADAAEYLARTVRSNTQSPGIPGGTANMTYFHLPLSAGISGTTTPLAAVAGAQLYNHRYRQSNGGTTRDSFPRDVLQKSPVSGTSSLSPSSPDPSSRPPSQHHHLSAREASPGSDGRGSLSERLAGLGEACSQVQEQNPEDIQIVAHIRYTGDLRLSLTAEILLDYPMPSFVGIPLKLNITGLIFDGVAILAYIKKRAHFCFLSPEDADALVGRDNHLEAGSEASAAALAAKFGGLLEHIKVESEIGDKETGKQVLKNVGKVEKFVHEQVRRIFEDELVYPSFWTFLV